MNIDKNRLDRYLKGESTPEEQQLIEAWYAQLGADSSLDEKKVDRISMRLDQRMQNEGLLTEIPVKKLSTRKSLRFWYASAAAAALLVFGIYFFSQKHESNTQKDLLADIKAPQGTNAVIVLGDQREVELDKLKNGDTIHADGYQVFRNEHGEITYKVASATGQPVYNTVRTKAGGMTSVQLADGSRVWVNSNSELKYPISFAKNQREVSLNGEAYFEVEKDATRPFYVKSREHTVKVLGTRFNVQNYDDEYKSTLLEGKIALTNKATALGEEVDLEFPVQLRPNQSYDGNRIIFEEDANRAIDWKEGYFDFSNTTLELAAVKLSNWYAVKIKVDGALKNRRIYAQIDRQRSLKDVLETINTVIPIKYEWNNNEVLITNLK